MKQKNNYWKIASIVLFFSILIIGGLLYSNYNSNYDIDGLKIKKVTLDELSNSLDNKPFQVCSTSTNKCLIFTRLK